ncbi:XdhC family protein [Herbiconiux sp. YIM B11900]|uniref:XdhC family protein n=1 Tax=Herbiconiux sp. YIM B11900 TaxID=3404131 RepID=UPI003F83AE9C
MLELAADLLAARDQGRRLAVATVIAVDGSAPRALGTSMAVDDTGRVIGSISGGCVEGAVYDTCSRVLETGEAEVCEFGFSDDDAFAVGLSCGGRLTVFVHELEAGVLEELRRARDGQEAGIAVLLRQTGTTLTTARRAFGSRLSDAPADPLDDPLADRIADELAGAIHAGRTVRRRVDCEGEVLEAVLIVSAPPPRLIVFGAVDFSVALSNAAQLLGFRVTVCDARPVFATPDRFPGAEVVTRWPVDYLNATVVDERTVICVLTHDDKFDVPLIEAALALPVAYVGAMGSRITHDRRVAKLRERGLGDHELAALHSPIGLDLGASSPEETAVSILAEVLAARHGGSGRSLRRTEGAIHLRAAAEAAVTARSGATPR